MALLERVTTLIRANVNDLIDKAEDPEKLIKQVMIDMRNGDIWGFPTLASTPYPIDTTKSQPAVSPPIYLGQFDFSKMTDAARNAR